MAVENLGSGTRQLEFLISRYFDVQQLSSQVRQKWEQASEDAASCSLSLDEISRRQQAAEDKRRKQHSSWRQRTKAFKRALQSQEEARKKRAQKLEEKLAVAEIKRQNSLGERRMKATAMLQRTLEAAERLSERQTERAARLDAKLEQAERMRELQIAAAAARGGGAAAHAKAVSAAARAREEAEASKRKADLEMRLQRAGDARHELTQTVLASLANRGVEPFLVRRALTRSILRRQSSSRVLQRCWRAFASKQQTTAALASRLISTGVPMIARGLHGSSIQKSRGPASPQPSTESQPPIPAVAIVGVSTRLVSADAEAQAEDPFEQFARKLQSPAALAAATALLRRLALKLKPRDRAAGVNSLLKRLFPRAQNPDRYPARVFLCAYMILKHPKVVFSQKGAREAALSAAAAEMLANFEVLLQRLVEPPTSRSSSGTPSLSGKESEEESQALKSTAALLAAFDAVWLQYLEQFVAWKLADAASLEAELVRVAVEMEASKLAKLGSSGLGSPRQYSPEDRQALVEQVSRDHELLRERIQRLGGAAGIARLDAGLAAARAAASGSPSASPTPPQSPNRPQSSKSAPTTPIRPTSAAARSPSTPGSTVTNESLAWELLYDLNYQLPTQEAEASWRDATEESDVMREDAPSLDGLSPAAAAEVTARRVRRIAEKAFWDSVADSGPEQLAALLSELAMQLVEALPPRSRVGAQVKEQFGVTHLQDAIGKGASETLLPAFEQLATVLHEVGSPARQQPAMATHARIRGELNAHNGDPAGLGRVLVMALRLMAAQLRLLQLDMSNATLRMLAGSLAGGEGVRYARQKFGERHEIKEDASAIEVADLLPHTRAWLAQASGQLQGLEGLVISPASNPTQSAAPAMMRTGRPMSASAGKEAVPPPKAPGAAFARGLSVRSWRGLVRVGLVSLVTAEPQLSVPPPPLGETLMLDAARMHQAKEAFQHVVVLSACMLVVQQAAVDRRLQAPQPTALKPRLKALLADENVGLQNLAAELSSSLAGAVEEEHMKQSLQRVLARSSTGFRALSTGLSKVLQRLLLSAEIPDGELRKALARFGAGELVEETRSLEKRLQEVAAVSEAVHEDLYVKLSEGLL